MYFIGIDIGGMSIKGGLVDEKGTILFKHVVKTGSYSSDFTICEDLSEIIDRLILKGGISIDEVSGIGIGSPGAIDPERGVIKYSNNIPMADVHVRDILKKRYPVNIEINNDANCAALGEARFGGGAGAKDVIFITLGTGVGSGIIIDGKLFCGGEGAGAEAGHTVIRTKGQPCTCGRKGCWEMYASATALKNQTKALIKKHPETLLAEIAERDGVSGKTAFEAAKLGDRAGKKVVDDYLGYVAEGMMNLANIFRPQIMVIGGGVSHEGESILEPIQKKMDKLLFGGKYNPKVRVVLATLGNDAGLLGAAALVM